MDFVKAAIERIHDFPDAFVDCGYGQGYDPLLKHVVHLTSYWILTKNNATQATANMHCSGRVLDIS